MIHHRGLEDVWEMRQEGHEWEAICSDLLEKLEARDSLIEEIQEWLRYDYEADGETADAVLSQIENEIRRGLK